MCDSRTVVRAFLVTAALSTPLVCQGQQPPTASPVAEMLPKLHAAEWTERASAFKRLRSDSKALMQPDIRRALLDLLDREDRLIESTLRDSHETVGVSAKYGEGFGDYVGELGDTVDSFADWNDPHQVCIYVRESYNPDSEFAAEIASHGKTAMPCLIEMFGSDLGAIRAKAAPVLVQALAKTKNLDLVTIREGKQAIQRALHDPHDLVRINVVRALATFAGEDMIPALKHVADTDPSPEFQGRSIRKWAAEAIVAIQKRAAQTKK